MLADLRFAVRRALEVLMVVKDRPHLSDVEGQLPPVLLVCDEGYGEARCVPYRQLVEDVCVRAGQVSNGGFGFSNVRDHLEGDLPRLGNIVGAHGRESKLFYGRFDDVVANAIGAAPAIAVFVANWRDQEAFRFKLRWRLGRHSASLSATPGVAKSDRRPERCSSDLGSARRWLDQASLSVLPPPQACHSEARAGQSTCHPDHAQSSATVVICVRQSATCGSKRSVSSVRFNKPCD